MSNVETTNEAVKKVASLIKDIKLAMMTTVDADGTLHSRPMGTQDKEFDGTLYFLTGKSSHKLEELNHDAHVNIAYANPYNNQWVSVAGTATASHDQQKIDELRSPFHKAWFPEGKEDPSIMVIRVDVDSVEYWEAASSKMVQVAGLVKSLVTGKPYRPGENKVIDMNTGGDGDTSNLAPSQQPGPFWPLFMLLFPFSSPLCR